MSEEYIDLEIHILQKTEQGYPVQLRLDSNHEFSGGYLESDFATWKSRDSAGESFWAKFLSDQKIRDAWNRAIGLKLNHRIRLWIDAEAPELHVLPWEAAVVDGVMLSANANSPFSRYLPSDTQWGKMQPVQSFKVLVAISNPENLDDLNLNLAPINVAKEKQILEKALKAPVVPTFLEGPVTLSSLAKELQNGYQGLHLMAHGNFGKNTSHALLYLQDDDGFVQIINDTAFCRMLQQLAHPPALVFLAACEGATRSDADAFRGLAPMLVKAGIPAVVAMQAVVTAGAVEKLSSTFYSRLARHGVVDQAMNEARGALVDAASDEATVPALFMRLKDGRLWPEKVEVKPPDEGSKQSGLEVPVIPLYSNPGSRRGLSSQLLAELRKGLMACEEVRDSGRLYSIFGEDMLRPWQSGLPEAGSLAARVDLLISYLSEKRRVTGENALVLLLQELLNRSDSVTDRYTQLYRLVALCSAWARGDEVAPAVGGTVFDQRGQVVGQQINVAGDFVQVTGNNNVVGSGNTVNSFNGGSVPSASLGTLRQQLQRFDDVELDELCLDYFPTIYDKFSRGMRRDEKINLLLDYCRRDSSAATKLTGILARR